MSRRCDREGVVWPRLAPSEAVLLRAHGLDMLHSVHGCRVMARVLPLVLADASLFVVKHGLLAHLRERPALPPEHAPTPAPVCPAPTEVLP